MGAGSQSTGSSSPPWSCQEVKQMIGGTILQRPFDHVKEFVFYIECNGKQESGKVR